MRKLGETLALSPATHTAFIAGSYAALASSLYFKAQLLDAVVGRQHLRELIILCLLFAGLHVVGVGIRMSGTNLRQFAKLIHFERSWRDTYPCSIGRLEARYAEAYFNHA